MVFFYISFFFFGIATFRTLTLRFLGPILSDKNLEGACRATKLVCVPTKIAFVKLNRISVRYSYLCVSFHASSIVRNFYYLRGEEKIGKPSFGDYWFSVYFSVDMHSAVFSCRLAILLTLLFWFYSQFPYVIIRICGAYYRGEKLRVPSMRVHAWRLIFLLEWNTERASDTPHSLIDKDGSLQKTIIEIIYDRPYFHGNDFVFLTHIPLFLSVTIY